MALTDEQLKELIQAKRAREERCEKSLDRIAKEGLTKEALLESWHAFAESLIPSDPIPENADELERRLGHSWPLLLALIKKSRKKDAS